MSFDEEEEELFVEEAVVEEESSESDFSVVEDTALSDEFSSADDELSTDSFATEESSESILADYTEPESDFTGLSAPTSTAPVATSFETPAPVAEPSSSAVYYVKADIDLVDGPGGGSIIGKASQGDPVLVKTRRLG